MEKKELLKRIEKKQLEISKSEKLLEKYIVKSKTIEDEYDLESIQDDIKRVGIKIRDSKTTLGKYLAQLEKINLTEAKPRIEVVEQLLDFWEVQVLEHYRREYNRLKLFIKGTEEKAKEIEAKYGFGCSKEVLEEQREHKVDYRSRQETIRKSFAVLTTSLLEYGNKWEERLCSVITRERNNKRENLIARVEEIVGQITDASNLSINCGDINGYIIGTNGKCTVNTIGAGGYNIQCYHYRVLVKKID